MADLSALQTDIGVAFKDLSFLEQALIHRSYLHENPDPPLASNERLEFLGDALLGFAVAERLYRQLPHLSEGRMTKLRASLVSREAQARLSTSLRLGDHLRLGRGEEASGGRHRPSNLARALEAVIGAIFLDQGLATAVEFIWRLLGPELPQALAETSARDPKSRLQELVQAERQLAPVYRTVETAGPGDACRFTSEVLVGDQVIGRGTGRSKQMAEKEAARIALESWRH